MLRSDKDETIKNKISGFNELAQKEYKTRHDCVGTMIDWELDKNINLTIRTSGISTTWNPYWRLRRTNFSEVLRYKSIATSWQDDQS